MVQNLLAYFILYVIKTKSTKCKQEKIGFSCMLKTMVDFIQKFRKSLLGYKDKATIKTC